MVRRERRRSAVVGGGRAMESGCAGMLTRKLCGGGRAGNAGGCDCTSAIAIGLGVGIDEEEPERGWRWRWRLKE